MDASCEVCGVVREISDEAVSRHLVHFECVACGTPHYATRSGSRRTSRAAAPWRRRSQSSTPPPLLEPGVEPEALNDLRIIAQRSADALGRTERFSLAEIEEDLAPPSVRAAIRGSEPPLPGPRSLAPWIVQVAAALRARTRRGLRLGAALMCTAVALAAGAALAQGRSASPRAAALEPIAAHALSASHRASFAAETALREQVAAPRPKPSSPAKAAPPPKRAVKASVAPTAPPAEPPKPAQPAPATMTLQEAMAAAAGRAP